MDGPSSGAIHLAVDANGNPWVITKHKQIYRRKNGTWTRIPGRATDIAIGHDNVVWILGEPRASEAGHNVFRRTSRQGQRGHWLKIPGIAGVRIGAGSQENAWVVDHSRRVFRFKQ